MMLNSECGREERQEEGTLKKEQNRVATVHIVIQQPNIITGRGRESSEADGVATLDEQPNLRVPHLDSKLLRF